MELKKGQTIMVDVDLKMPAAILHEVVSNRSGMPLEGFALYYQSKQLEGKAALSSWGVEKDATIEVKSRGRGGMKVAAPSSYKLHALTPHSAQPCPDAGLTTTTAGIESLLLSSGMCYMCVLGTASWYSRCRGGCRGARPLRAPDVASR